MELDKSNEFTPNAYLRIEQTNMAEINTHKLNDYPENNRGIYVIKLENKTKVITIK